MRRFILITFALLFMCNSALAYLYNFDEQNFYGRVYGGIAYAERTNKVFRDSSSHIHVEYHPAANFGFNLGYRYEHWKLEYEFSHSKHKHKLFNMDGIRLPDTGGLIVQSHMANLLYSFADEFYATVPYIGAGMGTSYLDMSGYKNRYSATVVGNGASGHEFTYQGIVGIGYYLNRNFMIDMAYRHLGTSASKQVIDDAFHSNHLLLGLTYNFM